MTRKTRSVPVVVAALALWGTAASGADLRVVEAARNGDASAVRALVQKRADVTAAAPDGTTALHWAVRSGDADLVAVLIRAGAAVGAKNRYGVT
ncbi:MAG TPA: ankyrin repeat domain-containing protein, partial [Vicinamibacterales bacterium]